MHFQNEQVITADEQILLNIPGWLPPDKGPFGCPGTILFRVVLFGSDRCHVSTKNKMLFGWLGLEFNPDWFGFTLRTPRPGAKPHPINSGTIPPEVGGASETCGFT
jgi:hypothetical protein